MKHIATTFLFSLACLLVYGQASQKDFKTLLEIAQPWACYSNGHSYNFEEWEQVDDVSIEGRSYALIDDENIQNSMMMIHYAPNSGQIALTFTQIDADENELNTQILMLAAIENKVFTFHNKEDLAQGKSLAEGHHHIIMQSFDCSRKGEIIARKQYADNKGQHTVIYVFKQGS